MTKATAGQSLNPSQVASLGPAALRLPAVGQRAGAAISRLTLAQKFMAVCLVILVAGALVLGRLVGGEIRAKVIHRTSATTAMYVDSFISEHLQEIGTTGRISPEHAAQLDTLTQTPSFRDRIPAIKVWSPQAEILYATNKPLVGRRFVGKAAFQRAVSGEISTELSSLEDAENALERPSFDRLLETYAPVRQHDTGRVIGVAEFYQDPSDLLSEISAAQRKAWLVVGLATFGMYLSLSFLVAGASRTITRQNKRLEQTVGELSALQSITDSALSSLSLDAFLDTLLARVIDATRSDAGMVLLREGDSRLVVRAARGAFHPERMLSCASCSFPQRLLNEQSAGQCHPPADGCALELGLMSALGVPLVVGGEAIGAALVGTKLHRNYSGDDLRLLQVLSERVALFIQNASLQERALRAASEKTQTDERLMSRIAHDLHDGPAQNMAVALLRLESVKQAVAGGERAQRAQKDLDLIELAVESSLRELRSISTGLSLPGLDDMTLPEVVRTAVRHHEQLTGSRVQLSLAQLPDAATAPVKIAAFRLLQEALSNAFRHGGSAHQRVSARAYRRSVVIEVEDRGRGFDVNAVVARSESGLGLPGMRERVELLGGTLRIVSKPGEGTRVIASIPMDRGG